MKRKSKGTGKITQKKRKLEDETPMEDDCATDLLGSSSLLTPEDIQKSKDMLSANNTGLDFNSSFNTLMNDSIGMVTTILLSPKTSQLLVFAGVQHGILLLCAASIVLYLSVMSMGVIGRAVEMLSVLGLFLSFKRLSTIDTTVITNTMNGLDLIEQYHMSLMVFTLGVLTTHEYQAIFDLFGFEETRIYWITCLIVITSAFSGIPLSKLWSFLTFKMVGVVLFDICWMLNYKFVLLSLIHAFVHGLAIGYCLANCLDRILAFISSSKLDILNTLLTKLPFLVVVAHSFVSKCTFPPVLMISLFGFSNVIETIPMSVFMLFSTIVMWLLNASPGLSLFALVIIQLSNFAFRLYV